MLRKLMKYESKATGRVLLPLYSVLLVFAVLCRLFAVNSPLHISSNSTLGKIFILISIFGYGFTMAAVFVVTFFIIVQRFYNNLLGDEGYLMNTLPVAPWQNILSKLLVGIFWSIVSCFVAGLSIIILAWSYEAFSQAIPALYDIFQKAVNYLGFNIITVGIETILLGLMSGALSLSMIYASISLGHLFNKRKILASFGSFIVLSIAMNIILSIGFKILLAIGDLQLFNIHISSPVTAANLFLIGGIIVNGIFFAIYFFITNYVIKNKLNLE